MVNTGSLWSMLDIDWVMNSSPGLSTIDHGFSTDINCDITDSKVRHQHLITRNMNDYIMYCLLIT